MGTGSPPSFWRELLEFVVFSACVVVLMLAFLAAAAAHG